MDAHSPVPLLREIILFLALAGVLIPLLARLRMPDQPIADPDSDA